MLTLSLTGTVANALTDSCTKAALKTTVDCRGSGTATARDPSAIGSRDDSCRTAGGAGFVIRGVESVWPAVLSVVPVR